MSGYQRDPIEAPCGARFPSWSDEERHVSNCAPCRRIIADRADRDADPEQVKPPARGRVSVRMGMSGWSIDVYDAARDTFAGSVWCPRKPMRRDRLAAVQTQLGARAELVR